MKKLTLLFALLLTFALLTACGDEEVVDDADAEEVVEEVVEPEVLAVGDTVYAQAADFSDYYYEVAIVHSINGDEVEIAWDDAWGKHSDIELFERGELLWVTEITADEAVVGTRVIINARGFNSMVNYPAEIIEVTETGYLLKYSVSDELEPENEEYQLDEILLIIE
jgi:hypothetical protein